MAQQHRPAPSSARRASRGSERGVSVSVLVCAIVPAFVLVTGLVVDGATQLSAERRAQVAAAQAARAGADAAAPFRVTGGNGSSAAISAAQSSVNAHESMAGTVRVDSNGQLVVDTAVSVPSVFLGVIGIEQLTGHGSATADLRSR